MPDFYIDEVPVSNARYKTWLKADKTRMQPEEWKKNDELNHPIRKPDLPAKGMSIYDAQAFAAAHAKRLVTEVEWERAAVCSDIRWAAASWEAFSRRVIFAINVFERMDKLAQHAEEAARQGRGRITPQWEMIQAELEYQRRDLLSAIDEFRAYTAAKGGNTFPSLDGPVGGRFEDKSVFGVRDVVMNPDELLEARGPYASRTQKPFAARVDPFLSYVRVNDVPDTLYAVMDGTSVLLRAPEEHFRMRAYIFGLALCVHQEWGLHPRHRHHAKLFGTLTFRCAR